MFDSKRDFPVMCTEGKLTKTFATLPFEDIYLNTALKRMLR